MTHPAPAKTQSTPAFQAMLGVLPFLFFGLVSIWMHFGSSLPRPPIWLHPFLIFDAFVLVGFGVGILAGFPRCAYSYLWWALIFAWWMSDMGIYGVYRFDNRMWLLPLGILVLALLVRRSLRPLQALLAGLWGDLTLFTLGFFSFYTWLSVMNDENHNPYLLVFIIASTLAVCGGAWFYFRQTSAIRRVVSLIAGLICLIIIDLINNATWDWRTYYNLPEKATAISPIGLALVVVFLGLMILTGILTQKRQEKMK